MSKSPLHLYQVLEDEYERLHGEPATPDQQLSESQEKRLRNIIKAIHRRQHTAICLSGGGIRSATFGLGVLQGLARHNLLTKFYYLSTVSGGGYIGGWLSAWIHRHPKGVVGVQEELPSENPELLLAPEPEPIHHLRNYTSYLTPQRSFLSADRWTLVAITIRNLLLNWLVLIPLIVAVLALPRLFVSILRATPGGPVRWTALALAFVCGAWLIAYIGISRPSGARARIKRFRPEADFLKYCLTPLLISATLLAWYWAWINQANDLDTWERNFLIRSHFLVALILFIVSMHLAGWAVYTFQSGRLRRSDSWLELVELIIRGTIGALLLWWGATRLFPQPESLVSSPAIAAIGLHIPAILIYASIAVPAYLMLVLLGLSIFAGISSRWTEDSDLEWWARSGGWILIGIILWVLASSLVLIGPGLFEWSKYLVSAGGVIALLTALLGGGVKALTSDQQSPKSGPGSFVLGYALPLGAVLFAAILVIFLSLGTNYLLALISTCLSWLIPSASGLFNLSVSIDWVGADIVDLASNGSLAKDSAFTGQAARLIFTSTRQLLILITLTTGLGLMMARLINTNRFSYHGMYRNRLIRAYLGASRENRDRAPDPFTGFDPEDNLQMHELRPELLHSSSFKEFDKLVARLADAQYYLGDEDHHDPPSTHIVSKFLSTESLRLLGAYEVEAGAGQMRWLLKRALIQDLNWAILRKSFLFPPEVFQEWGTDSFPGEDGLIKHNRHLLDLAYEDEILPFPPIPPPLHLVNMTVNLVGGDRLAWKQHRTESFSVSPLHCGSLQIPDAQDRTHAQYGSYRRTAEYARISLGTAMTISGAAESTGTAHSSPSVSLLMAVFNVINARLFNPRLGWWLGSPGPAGQDYYRLTSPKSAVLPIVAEMFGLNDDRNSLVYLSDGGHFENLGLYEMVLRRCNLIVISDASADHDFQFDALGNAIQKVRTDFGIPIEFLPMNLFSRKQSEENEKKDKERKKKGAHCAIGIIRYSAVDVWDSVDDDGNLVLDGDGNPVKEKAKDGTIIYIKPVFYGDEPRDIYRYAMTHETFPHETTSDQSFSDAQFESYRQLGSYLVDTICEGRAGTSDAGRPIYIDLNQFLSQAQQGLEESWGELDSAADSD